MINLDSILKSRDITLPTRSISSNHLCGFSSSHVWLWELNLKEERGQKNWCFWTVVLEKSLESPLDYKEIQLVHPKGNQCWILIGRTDAEGETPILLAKVLTHWKRPWCWERLKARGEGDEEDEMVGWHHDSMDMNLSKLHELMTDRKPGVQQSCSCKESDTTEWLNWTELLQRADSLEKTLMLGKMEGRRRRGWQRMRWVGWHHTLNGH